MTNDSPRDRVADIWANWWDVAYFAARPDFRALYERLKLADRMAIDPARLRREAESAGMTKIVISATAFPRSPVDNRAVARLVGAAPDRLVGCASVDPRDGMAALHELRRAVRDDGLRALKLLPFLYDRPPDHAIYFPLYATAAELGIPVLILTGHTAVAAPSEHGRPLHLDRIALHFPELTIVAGHMGHPWTEELMALAWKHPGIYIDTSGHRPKYLPEAFRHFMNSYGRDKVLFGTGYPLTDFATPLAEARALGLRQDSLDAYLWRNAARIWGWGE
jgi:hypothetical protein